MPDVDEEYWLFVRRCAQFHNIWTIYNDLLTGKYKPSTGFKEIEDVESNAVLPAEMVPTVMFWLYSFFYSLIEDSDDGLDAFRIWRLKFPEEETAIAALEKHVVPLRGDLKVFRNRLGFHGSRSQKHESKGLDFFGNHSGTKAFTIIKIFKSLNAALISKDLARQEGSAEKALKARAWIDAIPARCQSLTIS
jgi:hypothetical protein